MKWREKKSNIWNFSDVKGRHIFKSTLRGLCHMSNVILCCLCYCNLASPTCRRTTDYEDTPFTLFLKRNKIAKLFCCCCYNQTSFSRYHILFHVDYLKKNTDSKKNKRKINKQTHFFFCPFIFFTVKMFYTWPKN